MTPIDKYEAIFRSWASNKTLSDRNPRVKRKNEIMMTSLIATRVVTNEAETSSRRIDSTAISMMLKRKKTIPPIHAGAIAFFNCCSVKLISSICFNDLIEN